MKTKHLFLFLLLLSSLAGTTANASVTMTPHYREKTVKKWVAILKPVDGMPIYGWADSTETEITWGSEDVYNVRTDAGLTFTLINGIYTATVTNAQWNAMVAASAGIKTMFEPANTQLIFLQKTNYGASNFVVKGAGKGMNSIFSYDGNFTGGANDNVIEFIGASNVDVRGITTSGNAKQVNAFWKFKSAGQTTSQKNYNITFDNNQFKNIWADVIQMGTTAQGESHSTTNITIENNTFENIGNPSQPYNFDDNTPDNQAQDCIDFAQTSWTGNIQKNWEKTCSGNFYRQVGYSQGSEKITPNLEEGSSNVCFNTMIDSYGSIVVVGAALDRNLVVAFNKSYNCTRNTGLPYSIEGYMITTESNYAELYEGRTGYEEKGINCHFKNDFALIYTGASPNTATARTVAGTQQCDFAQVQGYKNHYTGFTGRYDRSLGTSSKCPSRLLGIQIVGKGDSPTYQPTSWDNWLSTDYGGGFIFDGCMLYNITGRGFYSETQATRVNIIQSNCLVQSAYIVEDVVYILGPDWQVYLQIDGTGSPNNTAAGVSVNTTLWGNRKCNAVVAPVFISNWNNATKIKNTNLLGTYSLPNRIVQTATPQVTQ